MCTYHLPLYAIFCSSTLWDSSWGASATILKFYAHAIQYAGIFTAAKYNNIYTCISIIVTLHFISVPLVCAAYKFVLSQIFCQNLSVKHLMNNWLVLLTNFCVLRFSNLYHIPVFPHFSITSCTISSFSIVSPSFSFHISLPIILISIFLPYQ